MVDRLPERVADRRVLDDVTPVGHAPRDEPLVEIGDRELVDHAIESPEAGSE